jgi:AcrR family transcriptional regulator
MPQGRNRLAPRTPSGKEGARERKRCQTLQRITEAGLRLFIEHGYEATTLDAITAAAGISRRTFFYYFKSKEDIVLAWQINASDILLAAVRKESPDQIPFDVLRNCLLGLISQYQSEEILVIDRLIRSTATLRARKQVNYVIQEQALYAAMCELWPQPQRRVALRQVAMVCMGAMRLAIEAWSLEGGKRPIKKYLQEAFANLQAEICGSASRQ